MASFRCCAAFAGLALLSKVAEAGEPGELLLLQQMTRHGDRAPILEYNKVCPSDPFTYKYNSWNEELTALGIQQIMAVGDVTRRTYGDWLGKYNGSKMTMRAVDASRVLQTAEVALSTTFLPGKGPDSGPVFIPVHTVPLAEDSLLNWVTQCHSRLTADRAAFWNSTGAGILQAGKAAADPVTAFCGFEATTDLQLKDQVDGIGFDRSSGFLTNELTDAEILAAQNLTITLQDGDFSTDAMKTYMSGDLPSTLVENMNQAIASYGSDSAQKYIGYFTHRHVHLSLAQFFGWTWTEYNVPRTMINTGTTIWVELRRSPEVNGYDVMLKQYTPHCSELSLSECPVEPIRLPGCTRENGAVCSLEEFSAMVSQRFDRTGTWQTICGNETMMV
jgi:hypothetical protein